MDIFRVILGLIVLLAACGLFFAIRTLCVRGFRQRLANATGALCSFFVVYAFVCLSDPWVRLGVREEATRLFSWLG